jgi:hypothetical protein
MMHGKAAKRVSASNTARRSNFRTGEKLFASFNGRSDPGVASSDFSSHGTD